MTYGLFSNDAHYVKSEDIPYLPQVSDKQAEQAVPNAASDQGLHCLALVQ